MSHIVQIQTEVRDAAAVSAACRRLCLAEPIFGEAKLFSGVRTGWQVQLPGWRYPLVFVVEGGRVDFDNFGGRWGDEKELRKFFQSYAVEKCRLEARRRGHTVTEQQLADGCIKLTIDAGD